jgi:hypothetical protein
MSSDVRLSGPLFDGRAERAAQRGADAIRSRLAAEGDKLAAGMLAASVRHHGSGRAERAATDTSSSRVYQTGKYTMPVVVDRSETVVTSDLATYGPWLEGTGSRNHTTRFKGYNSFRRAGQALDRAAGGIADETMRPYIREMNGS